MVQQIVSYEAQFVPNSGDRRIVVVFQDGTTHLIPVETVEEFIAVTVMLGRSPVTIDTDKNVLTCGPCPVGE